MHKTLYILIILFVALMVLRSYYASEGFNEYEGFAGESKSLIICKASWCGHCKNAMPDFEKLVSQSPITLSDGSKIDVKMLDDAADKEEIAQYNVKGYPTIIVLDSNKNRTEYPGKRTYDDILSFLNGQ
jgi:thiol-disulfide isomerase/thioredoxin